VGDPYRTNCVAKFAKSVKITKNLKKFDEGNKKTLLLSTHGGKIWQKVYTKLFQAEKLSKNVLFKF
jgi:hypothetical protein